VLFEGGRPEPAATGNGATGPAAAAPAPAEAPAAAVAGSAAGTATTRSRRSEHQAVWTRCAGLPDLDGLEWRSTPADAVAVVERELDWRLINGRLVFDECLSGAAEEHGRVSGQRLIRPKDSFVGRHRDLTAPGPWCRPPVQTTPLRGSFGVFH
jgi:hypothetical protein